MPVEKRLIHGDILDADNPFGFEFDDAIDQQKRVAMRQDLPDLVNIQNGHGKGQYTRLYSIEEMSVHYIHAKGFRTLTAYPVVMDAPRPYRISSKTVFGAEETFRAVGSARAGFTPKCVSAIPC